MARKGDAGAIAALDGPPIPAALEYLYDIVHQLHGRSGVGMGGLMPLSYSTIADYSRLKDVSIAPQEVDALIYLDAMMLNPGDEER